jgi:hypothetical protein
MGNTLGSPWEFDVNTLRIGKKIEKKFPHLHLSPKTKKEEKNPLGVHVEPSHWLHEISISKIECHHFQHGLTTPIIN